MMHTRGSALIESFSHGPFVAIGRFDVTKRPPRLSGFPDDTRWQPGLLSAVSLPQSSLATSTGTGPNEAGFYDFDMSDLFLFALPADAVIDVYRVILGGPPTIYDGTRLIITLRSLTQPNDRVVPYIFEADLAGGPLRLYFPVIRRSAQAYFASPSSIQQDQIAIRPFSPNEEGTTWRVDCASITDDAVRADFLDAGVSLRLD